MPLTVDDARSGQLGDVKSFRWPTSGKLRNEVGRATTKQRLLLQFQIFVVEVIYKDFARGADLMGSAVAFTP
jgi:hypothetical protein